MSSSIGDKCAGHFGAPPHISNGARAMRNSRDHLNVKKIREKFPVMPSWLMLTPLVVSDRIMPV
jgi:hypothetical protein